MEFKMIPYTKDTELPDIFLAKVLEYNRETIYEGSRDAHTFVAEYITTGQVIGEYIYLYDMEENSAVAYDEFPYVEEYHDMRSCFTITEWCPLPKISITDGSHLRKEDIEKLNNAFGDVWNRPLKDEVKPYDNFM